MSVLFQRIEFGGVMSWNTQTNCRASEKTDVEKNFVPISYHLSSQVSPFDRDKHLRQILSLANLLFSTKPQHFCHHSFWTFWSAFHQLDDVGMSTFLQTDNRSWSCRTSILEGAILHKMSYCKFFWGNPCEAIETFYHWGSCLREVGFSMIFALSCTKEFGDGFDGQLFPRLFKSWRKLQLSPFTHCPLVSHCQQSPRILYTLFCSMILDHGVFLKISISVPKIISNFLFDTSLHHSFQSVKIRSWLLLMSLQVVQFQYGLRFLRLVFFISTILPRCHHAGSSSQTTIFRPLKIENKNIIIAWNDSEWVGIVFDRIMAPCDPKVILDQVSNLSAAKENGLASGPLVPPDWLVFWSGNYGWFCSVLKQSLHQVLQKFGIVIPV